MLCVQFTLFFLPYVVFVGCATSYHNAEVLPFSIPTKCSAGEHYDILQFRCVECQKDLHLQPSKNGLSCNCDDRSMVVSWNSTTWYPVCLSCGENEIPTVDQRKCITCPLQNLPPGNGSLCQHFLCPPNTLFVDRSINGSLLPRIECLECAAPRFPSANGLQCEECNPNIELCCSADDEICPSIEALNWPTDDASFTYTYLSGNKIFSPFLKERMRKAIYLCQKKNRPACQEVANLCVLFLYDDELTASPCALFRSSKRIPINLGISALPWIYYGDGDAPAVLSRRRISTSFSLNPTSPFNYINLTGAFYSTDGHLLRMGEVKGSELHLCPGLSRDFDKSLQFLSSHSYSCTLSVNQLLQLHKTQFIDLFLLAQDDNGDIQHAIPVLIKNLAENTQEDRSQWTLVRRFFLIDTVTTPSVVRVASRITLLIRLQGRQNVGKIYVPLLKIEYQELSSQDIASNKDITLEFSVSYEMPGAFSRTIEVAMGAVSGLAVLWAGIRTWSHTKRCGRATIDVYTLGYLTLFTCGCLANVFFLISFLSSIVVFVFYKGQTVVHMVLPTPNEEYLIHAYVTVAFFLKVVEVVYLLISQINVDIFLIDWERPRGGSDHPVSIWRTYFVANEWNELQTKRKIDLNLHLLVTIVVLQIIKLENWSSAEPQLYTLALPPGAPFSYTCRFAVGGLVYLTVYIVQWLLRTTVYERYVHNAIHEFVDLCSMANISVIMLTHERYGFYIHGRSAHGFADTDMQSIVTQLYREEEDLVGHRGLLPGTDQQTFEMIVPSALREYYDKVMAPLKSMSQRRFAANRTKGGKDAAEQTVQGYHNINRFFGAFLDHALKDLDYEVREKIFAEALLGIEFVDGSEKGVLFTDNGHSFDQVLWYGNEQTLLTFDLFLFTYVQLSSGSFLLAAAVTSLVALIVAELRQLGARHNLAKKTLTDDRFLL